MKSISKASVICLGLTGVTALSATTAFAQVTTTASAQPTGASSEDTSQVRVQDIVVTAQRREERLQDVPVSVTALSADKLAASHIVNVTDLQVAAPTLVYTEIAGFAQPFLRGIGTTLTATDVDPSVATYVDGVFAADSLSTMINLLGVQRIEVLNGPQGTLFGRAASAGAISITTLTPNNKKLEAQATFGFGDYDHIEFSGHASGPVTDNLAVGVYFGLSKQHTYWHFQDPTAGAGDGSKNHSDGVRVKAVYTPTSTIKFTATYEHTESNTADGSILRNIQPDATGYAIASQTFVNQYRLVQNDSPSYARISADSATLKTDIDLGWSRVVNIANYRRNKFYTILDADGTAAPLIVSFGNVDRNRTISEELQLLSPDSSPVKWIGGFYYFNGRGGWYGPYGNQLDLPLFGVNTAEFEQARTQSYSAFGQATFPIASKLALTVGGRYSNESKEFSGVTADINAAGMLVSPVTYTPDRHTWRKFTPKVVLEYKPINDVMVYANVSQGWKAGAYNLNDSPPGQPPLKAETITAYEAGLKSEFLDHRLRLNIEGYYYSLKNLQVTSLTGQIQNVFQNAPSANAQGVDGSLTVVATRDLTFNAQGGYEQGRYTNYPNSPGVAEPLVDNTPVVVNSGALRLRLQRMPKWTGSFSANYSHDLSGNGHINADVSGYYNGGFFWDTSDQFSQSAYFTLSASLGYTFPNEKVSVRVWGTNLTNAHYGNSLEAFAGAVPSTTLVNDAAPRMFGATITAKY